MISRMIPPGKVRKGHDGLWNAWRYGEWVGKSSYWHVALALALVEPCDLPDGGRLGFNITGPYRR